MQPEQIVQRLNAIDSLEEPLQLYDLEVLVQEAEAQSPTDQVARALFGVLERFPHHDGYGIFWSILHLLEKTSTNVPLLIDSVRRCPTDFNVLMVRRLLNAGIREIDGLPLVGLLRDVAAHGDASEEVREQIAEILDEFSPPT